jgi:hypothetical protein
MWAKYEIALASYAALVCREWRRRGFNDTLHDQFMACYALLRPSILKNIYPPWFNMPELHASHRSNLLRKDYSHYSRFGWMEPVDLPYLWPVPKYEQEV